MKSPQGESSNYAVESTRSELTAGFQSLPATVPVTKVQLDQISPTALAYLGDAVYELYIRSYYLLPSQRLRTYHKLVVAQVRAEAQALHLRSLIPNLNHTELDIVRRGRNAANKRSRQVDPEIYQQATSLETLIGYLYLADDQRLLELLQQLNLEPESEA